MYNLGQLNKLVDELCKDYLNSEIERNENIATTQEDRDKQKLSLCYYANSSLEHLLQDIQSKIRIHFPNVQDAFKFFDVQQGSRFRKEHFLFNCKFLHVQFKFNEIMELFNILDTKQDDLIDESEFGHIFRGVKDTWNAFDHNIMDSILRDSKGASTNLNPVDISLAFNTIEKEIMPQSEIMGKLHFSKTRNIKEKLKRQKSQNIQKRRL